MVLSPWETAVAADVGSDFAIDIEAAPGTSPWRAAALTDALSGIVGEHIEGSIRIHGILSESTLTLELEGPVAAPALATRTIALGELSSLEDLEHRVRSQISGMLAEVGGERVRSGTYVLFYLLGGALWAILLVTVLRSMFPAFHGFERIVPKEIFRALGVWALLVLTRSARSLLLYGLAAFAVLTIALRASGTSAGELSSSSPLLLVIVPAAVLLLKFALMVWLELRARRLDAALVVGSATAQNPWHVAVKAYLTGYMHRIGWADGGVLLRRTCLLPGRRDQIMTYGGGLGQRRIVIPKTMLELACAPYGRPHDYAPVREDRLHWTEWNAGLVTPTTSGLPPASREQRRPQVEIDYGESDHSPIGQPPTLAGYLEPRTLAPKDQYRPGEDPMWLSWQAHEEFDGTDPNDRDFLFGALVRELGVLHRGDGPWLTLQYQLGALVSRLPSALQGPLRTVTRWFGLGLSSADLAADAVAALNHARHHLLQYIAWLAWHRDDLLTSRAHPPELEAKSKEIVALLRKADRGADGALADRMSWLARFMNAPHAPRSQRRKRRAAAAIAVAAAVTWVAVGVARAVDYQGTYQERMDDYDRAREDR